MVSTCYSFRDVYNSHIALLVYVIINIDAFILVSPSSKFPWISSLPSVVLCTHRQKLLHPPLSVVLGLHLYYTSPLIFTQGIPKQSNWLLYTQQLILKMSKEMQLD